MISFFLNLFRKPPEIDALGIARSGRWPKVRATHLAEQKVCMVCGCSGSSTTPLEVHHIVPVHIDPTRELDPTNLITLCHHDHWLFGHYTDWKSLNSSVVTDAASWRDRIKNRPPDTVADKE